tara:strand:+ start:1227 stop:1607 length:381 start_codon:yes stop_codon:yes gene_type:complete
MKLINTNKKGTQTFELKDGRIVKSYPSGYIRMTKQIVTGTRMGKPFVDYNNTCYQLNRVEKINIDPIHGFCNHKRILIPCVWDRMEFIKDWEKRNCKLNKSEIECAIKANRVYEAFPRHYRVEYTY